MDESQLLDDIDDVVHRMEAAIRKLPILPEKERFVFHAAALVATSAYLSAGAPQYPPRGDKAAIRELSKLAEHLDATKDILEDLSAEAFRALFDEPPGPEIGFDYGERITVRLDLAGLREQALLAKARLEAKPEHKGGGRPPKYQASDVAARALGCYEALTGESAGVSTHHQTYVRSGPFVRFLTDVFKVMGIGASVDAQAKAAVKARALDGQSFSMLLALQGGKEP